MSEFIRIPKSVSDFRVMVKGDYIFADKSLLIRDLLNTGSTGMIFTRPRRFGKILAISMIDRLFNIKYREEEKSSDSFSGLRIERYPEWKESTHRL